MLLGLHLFSFHRALATSSVGPCLRIQRHTMCCFSVSRAGYAYLCCRVPQDDYVSGALHHVVLGAGPEGPLQPDTTYFYTCGDPDLGMSPEFSFRTPPVVGPESLPYRQAASQMALDIPASFSICMPARASTFLSLLYGNLLSGEAGKAVVEPEECLSGRLT